LRERRWESLEIRIVNAQIRGKGCSELKEVLRKDSGGKKK